MLMKILYISNFPTWCFCAWMPALGPLHIGYSKSQVWVLFEGLYPHLRPFTDKMSVPDCNVAYFSIRRVFHRMIIGFRCYYCSASHFLHAAKSNLRYFLYSNSGGACFASLQNFCVNSCHYLNQLSA